MDLLDPHSLRRDLSAFADGELDSVSADRLLRHLIADPLAMQKLLRIQQLTAATRRAVRDHTPPPSQVLLDRLHKLGDVPAPVQAPARSPRVTRSWWTALPRIAAAVAILCLGVSIGYRAAPSTGLVSSQRPDATDADVIPAAIVGHAEEIHGFCSRLAEGLHTAGYPDDVAPLASSVEQDLRSDHPYPDLASIGYRYRGAGPCGNPLPKTVHLLYRSTRPGSVKAVSVFVQAWHDQYPLAAGRVYTVSVASSPFPMLTWRTDRVVYFLLGDDATTVKDAAALICATPASRPSTKSR